MTKIALVTGGNRGIGFAACKGLAQQGVKVLLGCRNSEQGEKAVQQLQSEDLDVTAVTIDVSDTSSIEKAAEAIEATYGAIDILVNNAGVLPQGSLFEVSGEELSSGLDVNLLGPIHCIRAFTPGMKAKGYGRIVNVSSGWGSFSDGLAGPAVYSISKAALNAVTMTTAQSLSGNVKVNSMCPGWVHTRMGGDAAPRSEEEGADTIIWLATLPDDGATGMFFRDREEISW